MNNFGVSYRKIGPRGGKGKPIVYFRLNRNIPGAKMSQWEAFWRLTEKYKTGKDCWMWED
jgi:hypothetical protein